MKLPSNAHRWTIALALAALGGLIDVSTDKQFPGWWEICRHVLLGVGPTVVALKMTLERGERKDLKD